MADVEAGMGPFLGVLLASRGWSTGSIGAVITLGAIVGMSVVGPAGALVDGTVRKRGVVVAAALAAVAASAVILSCGQFWVVAVAQAIMCISGATVAPAVIGITLGVVGQAGFIRQNGRNQAYSHAGAMVGAALSGLLGWKFGYAGVFWLATVFAVVMVTAVSVIPATSIDHRVARGEAVAEDVAAAEDVAVKKMWTLLRCRPLVVLAAALVLFWLGNAAMLPFYGLAVVAAHAEPFTTVASTVLVAQGIMIPAALVAMRMVQTRGYWLTILVALGMLPIRGVLAAGVITSWGIIPVEVLDGIAGGMLSVAVPGLVARLLDGTGHINAGQGMIMAAQGLGGALSPVLAGFTTEAWGFSITFLLLGGLALGALVVWLGFGPLVRRAQTTAAAATA